MDISQDQQDAAVAARAYALRKRYALAKLVGAIELTRAELIEQARRLQGVSGRTASEALDLKELSDKYKTAAHIVGKLWGYQRGRLERMDAELREQGIVVHDENKNFNSRDDNENEIANATTHQKSEGGTRDLNYRGG